MNSRNGEGFSGLKRFRNTRKKVREMRMWEARMILRESRIRDIRRVG